MCLAGSLSRQKKKKRGRKNEEVLCLGTGPALSTLIGKAEALAAEAAMKNELNLLPDDWAVEVVTTEEVIDALTRFDDAVVGYVSAN